MRKAYLPVIFLVSFFALICKKEETAHSHHSHHHSSGSTVKDFTFCDVHKENCPFVIKNENGEVLIEGYLDLSPKPVTTMKEIEFKLVFKDMKLENPSIILDLTMPAMYMGENKVIMKQVGSKEYSGIGIFPFCTTDDRRWNVEIRFQQKDITLSKNIQFDVIQQ